MEKLLREMNLIQDPPQPDIRMSGGCTSTTAESVPQLLQSLGRPSAAVESDAVMEVDRVSEGTSVNEDELQKPVGEL